MPSPDTIPPTLDHLPHGCRFFVWVEDDVELHRNIYYVAVDEKKPAAYKAMTGERRLRPLDLPSLNAFYAGTRDFGCVGVSWVEVTLEGINIIAGGYNKAPRLDPEFEKHIIQDSKPFRFYYKTTHKIGVPKGKLP